MRIFKGKYRFVTILILISIILLTYYLSINYLIDGMSENKNLSTSKSSTVVILPTFTPAPKQVRVRYYPTPTAQPGQVANNTNQPQQQTTSQNTSSPAKSSCYSQGEYLGYLTWSDCYIAINKRHYDKLTQDMENTNQNVQNASQQMQEAGSYTAPNVVVPTINTQINMPVQPTSGVPVGYGAN